MEKINSLIVEDNRKASELLKNKLQKYCPSLDTIDQAMQLDEAKSLVVENKYDLIFLDIGMPTGSGFDLIHFLENRESDPMPAIIFTTGQNQKEYLLKAIRVSAIDYLYKPISNEELIQAVHKATTRIRQDIDHSSYSENYATTPKTVMLEQLSVLMVRGVIECVDTMEIKYLEADGTMTIIHRTEGKSLHSVRHLGYYKDQLLKHPCFFQISAAVVVNLSMIGRYEHSRLLLTFRDGETIHASKRGGKDLKDFLRN